MEKHRYLQVWPRNFANEYTIYSVPFSERAKAEALREKMLNDPNADAQWITRKEAERKTSSNRRDYKSGVANYCNPAGATEITPWVDRSYDDKFIGDY